MQNFINLDIKIPFTQYSVGNFAMVKEQINRNPANFQVAPTEIFAEYSMSVPLC